MNSRPHELIIFDCDGVLVDSEPIACDILRDALAEIGWSLTREELIQTFVGRSAHSTIEIIRARGFDVDSSFLDAVHERELAAFRERLQPVRGVPELLASLGSVSKCVASSSSHERIRTSLTATNLLSHFEGHVFSAHDVQRGKPAPDVFLHAARSMQVDAARSIVIEDSLAGVQAARSAGMTVVGYTGTFPADALLDAGAHKTTNAMSDLKRILDVA